MVAQNRTGSVSSSGDGTLAQILYPYGVGIDTHSKFIQVCILLQALGAKAQTIIRRLEHEFPTTWAGISAAHAWVMRHLAKLATTDDLRYCIESTGTYHFPILKNWQGVPSVINPHLTGPTRRKTDVLDARLLAHYSITGLWKASFIPTEQAQVLRVLWAAHREAQMLATRCSNRINNIVLRFGHTFGRRTSMRSAEGEGILSDLIEGHLPVVPDVSPGGLPESVRPLIAALLADLRSAEADNRAATTTALNYVREHQWPTGRGNIPGTELLPILVSVPGVGQVTALTWLAEVCDPTRFSDAKQVAAYTGCDPSLKVSAGKVTSYVKRQGNLRLHHALSYAARTLISTANEPLGRWGRSIAGRHKKGGYRKGTSAVSRRIGCMLWHVHRKGELFSYDKYALACDLSVPDTPLSEFLAARTVKVLKEHDIRRARDLAAAYSRGALAEIRGLGQKSLATIKDWLLENGTPVRPQTLADEPSPPKKSLSAKGYKLDPSRTYTKKPAPTQGTNEQEKQKPAA